MNKLVVYKKVVNGGSEIGRPHFYLIVSLHDIKDNLAYEISEWEYKKSIETFNMKNVASVFDECFEIVL